MGRANITPPGDYGPGDYGEDLNPDFLAGQNYGLEGPHPIKTGHVRTAYDIKNLHDRMNEFTDDELKSTPVLPAGMRLEQGATYIDLRDPNPREFTAIATMVSGERNWYVPKSDVGYVLWNRLIGVTNPERLDQADEGASDRRAEQAPGEPVADLTAAPAVNLASPPGAKTTGEPVPRRSDTAASDWAGESATGWAGRDFPQPQGDTGELY